ncbi:hypothetical protein QQM79_02615 [Marinobacteraceae bacterium S3BR75-40.1]
MMGWSLSALGDVEITPFAGYQFGSDIQLQSNAFASDDQLRFAASPSVGVILNGDLQEPGKQFQLYYSRQETRGEVDRPETFSGVHRFDVTLERLQFGGLYLPGGGQSGGFVDGTLGITRLAPGEGGLKTDYRPSLALGGGYKWLLQPHWGLRFDLRLIFTDLDTDAAIFCSGGCSARVHSSGFVQVETGLGMVVRF